MVVESHVYNEATLPVNAFGRGRPAADASREVVEHWLLDGLM